MKIYKSTVFPLIVILSLISAVFLVDYVPILQYADELVTILLLPYMVLGTIKRCAYIDKCIRNIIFLFVLIGLIGIASTVLNKVQPDKFAVCLDILTLSKIIVCPIGMYFLLNEHNSEEIIRILTPMAKFFLWSGLACALVSQFLNIGMTEYERNGIKSFYFIVGFQHLFSILVLCALLIILSRKYDLRYILIAIVQMILTLKGPSIIWSVTILFILYYFKRDREKIGKWVYVVLLLFCIIFGQFQIHCIEHFPCLFIYIMKILRQVFSERPHLSDVMLFEIKLRQTSVFPVALFFHAHLSFIVLLRYFSTLYRDSSILSTPF